MARNRYSGIWQLAIRAPQCRLCLCSMISKINSRSLGGFLLLGIAASLPLGCETTHHHSSNYGERTVPSRIPSPPPAPPQQTGPGVGYTDTPVIRGQRWRVHDPDRPVPPVVTPGAFFSQGAPPPSDAIQLFNGVDASRWQTDKGGPSGWKIENGYMEVVPKSGSIQTRDQFGDCQLHLEFATPSKVEGSSQGRGNSGIYFHGKFEVQILDSYNNRTYADGQVGALYGQWPPLANPIKPPGEWNCYDIVFEAPHFDSGGKLTKPGYMTVLLNGVVLHNRRELNGPTNHRSADPYRPYSGRGVISLQDHSNPTRFRNIWIRPVNDPNENSAASQ